jgi:cytochrome c-type biogenesis protein CcmH
MNESIADGKAPHPAFGHLLPARGEKGDTGTTRSPSPRLRGEGGATRRVRGCHFGNALTVALFLLLTALPLLAQQLKVPDAAQFVGQPQGTPLAGEQLFHRTNEVGALLRCPVCQGMAIADSPSEMAVNMKGQVRELLERGYTEEQILKYFELSYGQFVLLEPKFEGVTAWVWLLPLVALLFGAVVLYFTFKKLGQAPVAAPAAPGPVDDPYVARVRDLVSGGKQ